MENTSQLTLINSTYEPDEAREVLCQLLNDKIRFLNLRMLGSKEVGDGNHEHFEQRVLQLLEARNQIAEIVSNAEKAGLALKVSSEIHIELIETDRGSSKAHSEVVEA